MKRYLKIIEETVYIDELEPLKLEVGKFYKTRGGKKVVVLGDTYKRAGFPFIVAVVGGCGYSYPVRKDGRVFNMKIDNYDIVASWEE